ncbi:hypothetical protein [Rhodoferax fermentans]|uniref:Uncharacterized protein n=1 Tax=Rhodoferax fermentans TaxID=28066 RepID=A0A1T1ASV4_RHOFE|nr:hypothetical protein [Rhodoferax fermentans]MBK1682385.1 hypothetical protein [Rhodoferax fermentans]OOV07176.1 hypothetical protein RF819_10945 [Rhodoferax fermentans]
MSFCTRLLFVFVTLFVLVAASARACEPMSSPSVSAASHHSAAIPVADLQAVAGSADTQAPCNTETSNCSSCTSCAVCACLCVGLARPLSSVVAISSAMALPNWTAAPMASQVAAPELKPPRV